MIKVQIDLSDVFSAQELLFYIPGYFTQVIIILGKSDGLKDTHSCRGLLIHSLSHMIGMATGTVLKQSLPFLIRARTIQETLELRIRPTHVIILNIYIPAYPSLTIVGVYICPSLNTVYMPCMYVCPRDTILDP